MCSPGSCPLDFSWYIAELRNRQVHRELASGLSMPVGFKNATSGDMKIAVDAIQAAKNAHSFLSGLIIPRRIASEYDTYYSSVTKQGLSAIVHTPGNPYAHIVSRPHVDCSF